MANSFHCDGKNHGVIGISLIVSPSVKLRISHISNNINLERDATVYQIIFWDKNNGSKRRQRIDLQILPTLISQRRLLESQFTHWYRSRNHLEFEQNSASGLGISCWLNTDQGSLVVSNDILDA